MGFHLYGPEQQAVGAFDGGKIIEQKPIGFPGEGSAVKRVGPLFYWAWFEGREDGIIPFHPHKGFEILTYVMDGQVRHRDSLGTDEFVGAGGAQVMQTGSGALHEETMFAGATGFQIWFEPYMGEAIKRTATYAQYEHDAFPVQQQDGVTIKTVIGEQAPIQFVADSKMWDVMIESGQTLEQAVPAGYSLAGLVVEGDVQCRFGAVEGVVAHRDFAVWDAETESTVTLQPTGEGRVRVILIQVPTELGYLPYNQIRFA